MRFIKTLSGFYESTQGESKAKRRDQIDEHLFVEALALAAFEIVYQDPQPTSAEKIILMMERLNHSQGPPLVQKAYGKTRFEGLGKSDGSDLLHFIRISHPEYFGQQEVIMPPTRKLLPMEMSESAHAQPTLPKKQGTRKIDSTSFDQIMKGK